MSRTMPSAAHTTRPPKRSTDPVKALMAFGRPLQRISVDQYHGMLDSGALDDMRCELLHGWIFELMTPKPPHSKHVRALVQHLLPLFPPKEYVVGIQDAITLSDSEPLPDFFVATGPEEKYDERHPGPKDLLLIVEVAHTTLRCDRTTKLALYATEGIPQYWIVDVKARRLEVYSHPHGGKRPGYRKKSVFKPVDEVPVAVAGRSLGKLPVARLLP